MPQSNYDSRDKALGHAIELNGKALGHNHPTGIVSTADIFESYLLDGKPDAEAPEGFGEVIGKECFVDKKGTVIAYKGQNFYRACDALVKILPDGGKSFCVKRVDHLSRDHEDYQGNLRSN